MQENTKSFPSHTTLSFPLHGKLHTRKFFSNLLATMQGSLTEAFLQNVDMQKSDRTEAFWSSAIPLLFHLHIRSGIPSVHSRFILSTLHLFCYTSKREHVEQMEEAGRGYSIPVVQDASEQTTEDKTS